MIGGFKQVVANEGAGALLTGFGPTGKLDAVVDV